MTGLKIIMPVHNEEETVADTLIGLRGEIGHAGRVTVVDDHCEDASINRLKEMDGVQAGVELVRNENSAGFANALRSGISSIREEEAVVFFMADGCDEASDINEMLELMRKGYDVVGASRFLPGGRRTGGSRIKGVLSRIGNRMLTMLLPDKFTDWTNSFKIYRKHIFEELELSSRGFEISLELALKAAAGDYEIKEIPTVWRERGKGVSKFGLKDGCKYIRWVFFALALRLGIRKPRNGRRAALRREVR